METRKRELRNIVSTEVIKNACALAACIMLCGIPARRRGWRTMLGMVLFVVALAGGLLACGGWGVAAQATQAPQPEPTPLP